MLSKSNAPLQSVKVWSKGFHCWLPGSVVHEKPPGELTIEFELFGRKARKRLHIGSEDLLLPRQPKLQADHEWSDDSISEVDPDCFTEAQKWDCKGWQARGDAQGEEDAKNAQFLISFCAKNKEANDERLKRLRYNGAESALWENRFKQISFCTDRSLGWGAHYDQDGKYLGRTNSKFDYLQADRGHEYPAWFKEYMKVAMEVKHGLLILELSKEYFESKACRWEFGYFRERNRIFVLIDKTFSDSGTDEIISWKELMARPQYCIKVLSAFGSRDEAATPHEVAISLAKKAAKYVGSQEHQAWCEVPLLELAHCLSANAHGLSSLAAADSAHGLAVIYWQVGLPQEAADLLVPALSTYEREFGPNHPEVAVALGNLGNAHGALGDHKQEKRLLERALTIKEREFGPDHPEVAVTLGNLGNAHGALGDHKQKKRLLERALAIKEREFGPDHPTVARIRAKLDKAAKLAHQG